VDKQVWSGKVTRANTPDTIVRITFAQSGENVEGMLELGARAETFYAPEQLIGTLKDRSLSITTDINGDSLTGEFSQDGQTFSGTLTLLIEDVIIEDVKENFALTMMVGGVRSIE
jgi:hypothetical protein